METVNKPLSEQEIEERRAGLIEAALAILETEGIAALTMRRLAEGAGVSRQTPYLYFEDKAALCDAMCVAGMRRLTMKTTAAAEDASAEGYIEQLRLTGEAYVRFGLENPALYALIFRPPTLEKQPSPELQRAIDDHIAVPLSLMQTAWDDGLLTMVPDRLNHVFWAAMHGLVSLRNDGLLGDDAVFTQMLDDIETVLANGFLKKP